MKRILKMNLNHSLLFAGLLLSFYACKEEELVFPKQEGQEVIVTETRPTAKPTNLTLVSAFNQNVEIHWPALSDRVAKAQISYIDGGEKRVEVTDFTKPTIIHLDELKEYDFALKYLTADATASKVTGAKLTPRPYEVDYKLANVATDKVDGGVKFVFPNTSDKTFKYLINYTVNGEKRKLESENSKSDVLIVDKLFDDTKNIDFNITISDAALSRSKTKLVEISPGILPYKTLIPSFAYYYSGPKNAITAWTNTLGEEVTVKVEYTWNGSSKIAQVSTSDRDGELLLEGNPTNVQVTLTGKEGASVSFDGVILPPKEFADKASWTATVSDNQSGDGGGAAALIDNNTDTYWHSDWGTPAPFPHWFRIDFGKARFVSKISMIRRKNSSNGFVRYNLEVSVDGNNFTTVAKDIEFNPLNDGWQDYILPKTVKARYVRVTMTAPKNQGDAFTHLGEFSVFGY